MDPAPDKVEGQLILWTPWLRGPCPSGTGTLLGHKNIMGFEIGDVFVFLKRIMHVDGFILRKLHVFSETSKFIVFAYPAFPCCHSIIVVFSELHLHYNLYMFIIAS